MVGTPLPTMEAILNDQLCQGEAQPWQCQLCFEEICNDLKNTKPSWFTKAGSLNMNKAEQVWDMVVKKPCVLLAMPEDYDGYVALCKEHFAEYSQAILEKFQQEPV
jgi:hypothetical protein